MKRLPLIITAACAVLSPSCVRWNIGENILTAAETRVAVDYTCPVDGKLYRVEGRGDKPRYYARLAEKRFLVMPEIVRLDMYDFKGYEVCGAEPTGREVVAEVVLEKYSSLPPEHRDITGLRREVAALPATAAALPYKPKNRPKLSPHTTAVRDAETAPGPTRRAVASALSHSVDPLLTFVSTTAFWCCSIPLELVSAPFCWLFALNAEADADETKESTAEPPLHHARH